jgi:tetratricopeptide (TPR) repeat protein
MNKRIDFWIFFAGFIFFILMQTNFAFAKGPEEYAEQAHEYIIQKEFDKAISVLQEGLELYSNNASLYFGLAESYNNKQDYNNAVVYYLKSLEIAGVNAPKEVHSGLMFSYDLIGRQHYFSKELCLRIIYHLEKFLELESNPESKIGVMEFLRKSIGHFDMADMGVKMMEMGGDGSDFSLPDDAIGQEEKMQAREKSTQRFSIYDLAQKKASSYSTQESDKTMGYLRALLNARLETIRSIHFKRINYANQKVELLEEVFYKQPGIFKWVFPELFRGYVRIVKDKVFYDVDTQTNKIYDQGDSSSVLDRDPLKALCLSDLDDSLEKYYDLSIAKIVDCPAFLKDLYQGEVSPDIYLITGIPKKEYTYNVARVEYFIDTHLGMIVARKEYLFGILGSGVKEELGREMVVKKVRKCEGNLYLPQEGLTQGFAELSSINEDWNIEVISLNKEIDDTEFSLDSRIKKQ